VVFFGTQRQINRDRNGSVKQINRDKNGDAWTKQTLYCSLQLTRATVSCVFLISDRARLSPIVFLILWLRFVEMLQIWKNGFLVLTVEWSRRSIFSTFNLISFAFGSSFSNELVKPRIWGKRDFSSKICKWSRPAL